MLGINMLYDILADVIEMELLITAKMGDDCRDEAEVVEFDTIFKPRMRKLSETYAALKGDPSVKLDI